MTSPAAKAAPADPKVSALSPMTLTTCSSAEERPHSLCDFNISPRCFDSSKCSASDDGRRESRSNSEHGVVRPLLYVLSHVPHTFAFCVLPVSLFWRSGALSLFSPM